jgi:hypothetical protein
MNGLYNRKIEYTLTDQFTFDLNSSRIISAKLVVLMRIQLTK